MLKYYKVLQPFSSPLVGSAAKGDLIFFGEEAAKKWVNAGLVEEAKQESKPSKSSNPKKTK